MNERLPVTRMGGGTTAAFLAAWIGLLPVAAFADEDITAGLLSWYRLEGDAADNSGNGNHGTVQGAPQFVTAARGQGVKLDGSTDWVDIGPGAYLGAFTLAAWVRLDADIPDGHDMSIISDASTSELFLLDIRRSGSLRFRGGGAGLAISTTSPQIGQFYHVAVTYAGGVSRLYVNGALEGTNTGTPPTFRGLPNPQLGVSRASVAFFDGVIDEPRIYDRALTPAEVLELFTTTDTSAPLPRDPLVVGDNCVLVDLGTLGGSETHPAAINNSGFVVGWSFDPGDLRKRPLIWNSRDGATALFDSPDNVIATDINNQGWAIGRNASSGSAYLWKGGVRTDFPDGPSWALEINDAGIVVGSYGGSTAYGFRWDGSSYARLPDFGGDITSAEGINAGGVIVGLSNVRPGERYAAKWENGGTTIHDLGWGEAYAINDLGQIVGNTDGLSTGGWVRTTGDFTWLPTLGGSATIPSANNNSNVVVGESRIVGDFFKHAFRWSDPNGNRTAELAEIEDLNLLIPEGAGWRLDRATAINDHGTIVGEATVLAKTRGFLLAGKATMSGTVSNNQLAAGTVRVVAASFSKGTASATGGYRLENLPRGIAYWVSAYLDINGNGVAEPWEPQGAYGGNPFVPTGDATGIDITLITPVDSDGDGMPDAWETANGLDNGVSDAAMDKDGDGVSNLEEYGAGSMANSADTDGDGLGDAVEIHDSATHPALPDTDGDGMPDGWEVANGLNPRAADAGDDLDLDGLSNRQEWAAGLNPSSADSNGNGTDDYEELRGEVRADYTYDANDRLTGVTYANGLAIGYAYDGNGNLRRQVYLDRDGDGDGLPDAWEFHNRIAWTSGAGADGPSGDPDGDGWTNFQEWKAGTDPRDAASHPDAATTPAGSLRQTAPVTRILHATAGGGGLASVGVQLWDAEGNASTPRLQYFAAAGWRDAQITALDGVACAAPFAVAAEAGGSTHTIVWNTFAAFGATFAGDVFVRARADDFSAVGAWSEPVSYHVDINADSDNDGISDGWEMENGLDPLAPDSGGDIDRDGRSSLLEFALGTDPRAGSLTGGPVTSIEGDYLTLTVTRNPAADALLEFRISVSGDLVEWFSDPGHVTIIEDTPTLLKARDNVPFAMAPHRFIRLEVTKP